MSTAKNVYIVGISGKQGGAIARSLSTRGADKYKIHGCSRKGVKSGAVKALLKQCPDVQIHKVDYTDADAFGKSLGAEGGIDILYLMSDYLDSSCQIDDIEAESLKGMLTMAKEARVKHIIYSSAESGSTISKEQISVPQWEGKAVVERFVRCSGVAHTILHLSPYYENFLTMYPPVKTPMPIGKSFEYLISLPMDATVYENGKPKMVSHPLYGMSVKDLGECVAKICDNAADYDGKIVSIAGDQLTIGEYAEIMNAALKGRFVNADGKKYNIRYEPCSVEALVKKGGHAAEFAPVFDLLSHHPIKRDIEATSELNPDMQTFSEWLEHEKMLKMLVYHIEIASGTEPAAAKALADAILAPPVVKPPSKAEIAAARTQSENDKTRTMSGRNKNRADSTTETGKKRRK